jgi:hypothetical protein
VTTTAVATVSTPPKITRGEDHCITFEIIILTCLQDTTQQIYIDLLKNVLVLQASENFRMDDLRKDLGAFDYARTRSGKV